MDMMIRVQILNYDVSILHSVNIIGKGMYPTILPSACAEGLGNTYIYIFCVVAQVFWRIVL